MAAPDMKPTRPLVSVCVANYNGMAIIDACLQSILSQEGGLPVEILVHDDCSTDGSAAHIRANYPGVRLMESSANVGFCIANNRMAAEAAGDYLLLLNNDAELFPDALQSLLSVAERLRRPAILSLPQYDAATGELLDTGSLLDPFLNPVPNLDPQREEVGMVMGACLWIPRALWTGLGGFPEWFGSIGEDLNLCCHARLLGHPVIAVHRSGYRHRVGYSFGGGKVQRGRLVTSIRRRALSERNKSYVMVLTYPTAYLALLFPIHLAALLLEGLVLTLVKRDVLVWNEIYLDLPQDALEGTPLPAPTAPGSPAHAKRPGPGLLRGVRLDALQAAHAVETRHSGVPVARQHTRDLRRRAPSPAADPGCARSDRRTARSRSPTRSNDRPPSGRQ
ncbi:glycosyltransferase family 2 protein [Ramlibacter sp. MMS24-I3-19]|uniref:glycosyltransferase family 2 protein n=1 Tax=Ramlibacter sp. MMS24-I3-19 TaxID=3416606 RepID=UPI003CFC96CF